jgi:hypothetical protein
LRKPSAAKTVLSAMGGGLTLATIAATPIFILGYNLGACIVWQIAYLIGGLMVTSMIGLHESEIRPDRVSLVIGILFGALITSTILATPTFICDYHVWGCCAWAIGCFIGVIYTWIVSDPKFFEGL